MNAWTRRAAVLTLVCLLITALGAVWAYRVLWQRYDTGLAQLQARGERLEGIVDAGPQITQQLQVARSAVSPWLHPAGENAANALQQSLRERIAASGNTQVSSQAALEAADDDTLARVQASTAITGTWSDLVRFMQELQAATPPYWVSAATLSRDGPVTPNSAQTARLVLQVQAPLTPEKAAR